jgi:hypothetical protein
MCDGVHSGWFPGSLDLRRKRTALLVADGLGKRIETGLAYPER